MRVMTAITALPLFISASGFAVNFSYDVNYPSHEQKHFIFGAPKVDLGKSKWKCSTAMADPVTTDGKRFLGMNLHCEDKKHSWFSTAVVCAEDGEWTPQVQSIVLKDSTGAYAVMLKCDK